METLDRPSQQTHSGGSQGLVNHLWGYQVALVGEGLYPNNEGTPLADVASFGPGW